MISRYEPEAVVRIGHAGHRLLVVLATGDVLTVPGRLPFMNNQLNDAGGNL